MLSVGRLLAVAALTRAVYLVVTASLSTIAKDYDTSSELLSADCSDSWSERAAKSLTSYPLLVWDTVYFHRISSCGYEYEQFHAFFPAYPGTNRPKQEPCMLGTFIQCVFTSYCAQHASIADTICNTTDCIACK